MDNVSISCKKMLVLLVICAFEGLQICAYVRACSNLSMLLCACLYMWACKLPLVTLFKKDMLELDTSLIYVSPWCSTSVWSLAAHGTDHAFMLYGKLIFAGSGNRCASEDNNEEAIFHNPGKFVLYCPVSIIHYLKSDLILYFIEAVQFQLLQFVFDNWYLWHIGISLRVQYISAIPKELCSWHHAFVYWQWEALALLLIGISVNQLKSLPEGSRALGLPVAAGAYLYTLFFVSSDFLNARTNCLIF